MVREAKFNAQDIPPELALERQMDEEEAKNSETSKRPAASRTTATRRSPRRALARIKAATTRPELQRAEAVLDDFTKRVAGWTQVATVWAFAAYARAREEAEDVVAEAQNLRQKRQR